MSIAPAEFLQTLLQMAKAKDENQFDELRQNFEQLFTEMFRAHNPDAEEEVVEYASNLTLSFLDANFNMKKPVEKIIDAVGAYIEQLTGSEESGNEALWLSINDEVYQHTERYLNYTHNNQSCTLQESSNFNSSNSDEEDSSILEDVIVKIVLQSLANCLETIVCFFEFQIDWSGIFLPVLTKDSYGLLFIMKVHNLYHATSDKNGKFFVM